MTCRWRYLPLASIKSKAGSEYRPVRLTGAEPRSRRAQRDGKPGSGHDAAASANYLQEAEAGVSQNVALPTALQGHCTIPPENIGHHFTSGDSLTCTTDVLTNSPGPKKFTNCGNKNSPITQPACDMSRLTFPLAVPRLRPNCREFWHGCLLHQSTAQCTRATFVYPRKTRGS
ncbi:hypothetical protein J6590_023648 [Homalodisca vitripennis]|nr:hypothetical protein J6590_023648 [Homalodisca vitripennis]